MSTRRIAVGSAAVVAAFLVAFGIGKATNGSEAGEASGPAEAIEAREASISARAPARAKLPALKRERRQDSSGGAAPSGGTGSGSSGSSQQQQPADPEPANPSPSQSGSGSGGVTGGGVN